jgi:Spy/CpxP family protein refolding chaperone
MISKTFRRTVVSAGLGVLVLGLATLHAEKSMEGDDANGGMDGRAKMADHMKEHFKKALGLSDDQAKKVEELNKSDRESGKLLKDKVGADLANLKVLVDQKAGDAELKTAIESLKKDHMAEQDARMKHMEAMQAILTPMQQAKAAIMMSERMGHGRGRRGGWRGHGGADGDWKDHKGMKKDDGKGKPDGDDAKQD